MLSGLLITLDIFVCIALVIVVLLQRSEGGAFGMGGGPTGLITARGAGDLLTRTTWVLFSIFIALSLGLSLLAAHERATSSLLERLKLQQANPSALGQPLTAPAPTPAPAAPAPSAVLSAPPPSAIPEAAAAPKTHKREVHAAPEAPSVSLEAPSSTSTVAPPPPPIVAPPPKADESSSAPSGSAPATQP